MYGTEKLGWKHVCAGGGRGGGASGENPPGGHLSLNGFFPILCSMNLILKKADRYCTHSTDEIVEAGRG